MKRRKLLLGGAVAGVIVAMATAASRVWAVAAKELWRVDEELAEDDDIPPEQRPFLAKLNGPGHTESTD
ncbi:MAG TPA: hypothetical protein VF972_03420 [Actinomycetota bacterium]